MAGRGPRKGRRQRKGTVSDFERLPKWVHPATRLVHGSRRPERNAGAVVPPIYQTTTFHYPSEFSESAPQGRTYLYSRNVNPTQEVAAEVLRGLEGGEDARVFGSGMGAITATVLALVESGDEIVALENLYGGTFGFFRNFLPRYGVKVRWVADVPGADPSRLVTIRTKLLFVESPTNPLLTVHDLSLWARAAHRVGAPLAVDNTFATPINQHPIGLGADLVLHSGTKYLGGHSDLMAGALVGSKALLARVEPVQTVLGSVLDPFAAFLLTRGLRTLDLRVERQNENGRRVTEAIARHRKVKKFYYPGRSGPYEEAVCRRQMRGRGGVIAFVVPGGLAATHRFMRRLRLIHVASSLGGVESLVSVPRETSHQQLTDEERRARGIDDGLIRISLGIEDPDDLIRDISAGLDAV